MSTLREIFYSKMHKIAVKSFNIGDVVKPYNIIPYASFIKEHSKILNGDLLTVVGVDDHNGTICVESKNNNICDWFFADFFMKVE